jgi:hypothetical protein
MYSTNNVAGVKRIHEWIPRGRVPNDYNGELVQLMSRDAPPLLPSPRLKAMSITCAMLPGLDVHNELSNNSKDELLRQLQAQIRILCSR